ncbi:hypothetical protein F4677DRAFT_427552, partial [Hypoxylon crocopeplum]
MAKKLSNKHRTQNKKLWDTADWIQLLAYLDFSITYDIDFERTVVKHLTGATGKFFDIHQVERKLKDKWTRTGAHGSTSWRDLFDQGSSCLEYLTNEEKQLISEAAGRLPQPPPRRLLRSVTISTKARSKTLSSFERGSTSSRLSTLTRTPGVTSTSDKSTPLPRNQVTTNRQTKIEPIEPDAPCLLYSANCPRTVESDFHVVPDDKPRHAVELDHQAKIRENEILSLRIRLDALSKEHEELKNCVHTEEASMHDGELNSKLQYENNLLKRRLGLLRGLPRHDNEAVRATVSLTHAEIRQKLDILESRIADAASTFQWSFTFGGVEHSSESSIYLEHLLERAGCLSRDQISSVQGPEVIRSLAAASMCVSAFDSTFPDLEKHDSPLLDKYRSHIMARDGFEGLQTIDLLARRSLMSESLFQSESIAAKAQQFAIKFSEALAPFHASDLESMEEEMMDENLESDQMECDSSGIHSPSINPVAKAFSETFELALRLKIDLLGASNRYYARFIREGETFDSRTMNPDGLNDDGNNRRARGRKSYANEILKQATGREVKICLFPAIYSCQQQDDENMLSDPQIPDYLARSNIFIAEGDITSVGSQVVSKAVVM